MPPSDAGCASEGTAHVGREGMRTRSGSTVKSIMQHSTKSVEDIFADAADVDTSVVRDDMAKQFPMLCFCCADGPEKPTGTCRCAPGGHRGRLPIASRLLWVAPIFGYYGLKFMKMGYMHKFYLDDYPKASLGIIAFSSVLSVLMDAFTDPKMATWTDNLRSKYGRRRPFILASGLFAPTVFVLAWSPALVSPGFAASIWFGAFHILFKLADTLFCIPHDAFGAQLTPIYREKTMVWRTKEVTANLGVLFGMALVPFLFVTEQCTSTPDDGCLQLPFIAACFGALFCAACTTLAARGREPVQPPVAEGQGAARFKREDTIPMLISTALNKPFRILLVTDVVKAVGYDLPFVVMPFMSAWVLGEKCLSSGKAFQYLVLCNLIFGLMAVPAWSFLASKTSKYHAHLTFNALLALSCCSMTSIAYDSGDCGSTYQGVGLVCAFGAIFGGTFLINDLISDVVDYDQLLTGGLRREASYLMAINFVPKFMSIPGESVPFLAMAYFKYARPLKESFRPSCGEDMPMFPGMSPDTFCHNFYANETAGQGICSDSMSCQDFLANGVSFVCNNALGECGIKQNPAVRTTLLLCFSVVPAIFVFAGVAALLFYPRAARSEAGQEAVLLAIAKLKRGERVEDPWRPGSYIHPAEAPTVNSGALSYFMPRELRRVVAANAGVAADRPADVSSLWRWPAVWAALGAALLPTGVAVVAAGWHDLSDDLGASVSPLGLMLIGVGIIIVWFHGVRVCAAAQLGRSGVAMREVVAEFNAMAPFVGADRIDLAAEAIADGAPAA